MCLMSPVNNTYNGQYGEMGRENGLIKVMGLDFGTEGWAELGNEERGPWKSHHWLKNWVQGILWEGLMVVLSDSSMWK